MTLLSRVGGPVVWLLTPRPAVLRLLGLRGDVRERRHRRRDQDRGRRGTDAGVIETRRAPHDRRRHAPRRPGRARRHDAAHRRRLDRPRPDRRGRDPRAARSTPHSRLPLAKAIDNMVGVVQARDAAGRHAGRQGLDIRASVRQAPVVPDTLDALDVLEVLREADVPMALVHDEYGHFEGVVTPADILDAIAGAFRSDDGEPEPDAVRREDGSWLLAGSMPVDEMADQLGIPLPAQRDYETVAGLIIDELQHLPATGERVDALGWRFEVVDLDGRRIDKVLATPLATAQV